MTEHLTQMIKENKPFIFAKFGDGEYNCANFHIGSNCDRDPYTQELGKQLRDSIRYYSALENAYIGVWHTERVTAFFNSITDKPIKWVHYHTCIMDDESFQNTHKLELFRAIRDSPRKKILLANPLLERAVPLLNVDYHVKVPLSNWFSTQYEQIYRAVVNSIGDCETPLVITCAGMASKVIIRELHKLRPNGIYIDIGSGLDYLCTKRSSRGNSFSYQQLEAYFADILPPSWNNSNYDIIFKLSSKALGLHLPR